jgi:hypothetical protein
MLEHAADLASPAGPALPRPGATAVIGGVEYAVGGWASYEVARRRARRDTGGESPGARYARPGARALLYADEAARSILGGARAGRTTPLQRAATRLADTLAILEDRLCDPDDEGVWECASPRGAGLAAPPLTSADLRAFAADPSRGVDPDDLYSLSEACLATAASVGALPTALPPLAPARGRLPPLPARPVPIDDDDAVLRLEAESEPYASAIEDVQAALARQMEATGAAIRAALSGDATHPEGRLGGASRPAAPASGRTRGEEVDAAAKHPPSALLERGLPWQGGQAFDLTKEGVVVPQADGVFFGLADRDSPSRTTLLTPERVALAAFKTSARLYAWVVLDSPEARFAVRAPPRAGRAVRLDPDAIAAWVRSRLRGRPPHKVGLDAYLEHLRSLGLVVAEGGRRFKDARFDVVDSAPAADRARELAALRALTEADFARLDWSQYDRAAAAKACSSDHEAAGDVTVDLAAGAVLAPKIRPGTIWGAMPHFRSYVTFHTHPAARFQGARAEPPSPADVLRTLEACALDWQAWAFVSAPEGTYVLRPSAGIAAAYLRAPEGVRDDTAAAYSRAVEQAATEAPEVCARDAVRALVEAGFIAFLRGAPCVPLLPVPDLTPLWNLQDREKSRAAFARAAALSGEELLRLDWSPAAEAGVSPTLEAPTWLTAAVGRGGRVEPSGNGHAFGNPAARDSYPTSEVAPLFVVFFPDDHALPARVPDAAIEAARTDSWAWVVFLTPARVLVFRAGGGGVETHGPTRRAGA